MAESTLSIDYDTLRQEVGYFCGVGRVIANWSSVNADLIDGIVQAGLRQFYYPPPLPEDVARSAGVAKGHEWTFLRPVTTLATVAGGFDYTLPDDFGGLDGSMTFDPDDDGYESIRQVGEAQIRHLQHGSPSSGIPRLCAVRPKTTTGTTGQRFELLLFPTPNAVYTLSYRYNVLPSKLTQSAPYPYGGSAHSETLLQSCLAIAEQRADNDAEKLYHYKLFLDRLRASIALDNNRNRQEFFGYNGDRSDELQTRRHVRTSLSTYNGTLYE